MSILVDLSHTIEPDMPRFAGLEPPRIDAVWTHAEAHARGYQGTSCQVTRVSFATSIGTYLDAPFHFDPDGPDISQLVLSQLVLPGLLVDLRDRAMARAPLPANVTEPGDIAGKALLLWTGWSDHWGRETYSDHPYVSRVLAERLAAAGPALVGIDTLIIDDPRDLSRPAHTLLLRSGIPIVENLTNLGPLVGASFTFIATPPRVAGAASFPVRAFAVKDSPRSRAA
jgi:kynurenine formamidase